MAVSAQVSGIVVVAILAASGLAIATDITDQRSVTERMLYYQADEIAMDIETMHGWPEGSQVELDLPSEYGMNYSSLGTPENRLEEKLEGNPGELSMNRSGVKVEVPVYHRPSGSIDSVPEDDFSTLCIEKSSASSFDLSGGGC